MKIQARNFCVDKPNQNGVIIDGESYFAALNEAINDKRLYVTTGRSIRVVGDQVPIDSVAGVVIGYEHHDDKLTLTVSPTRPLLAGMMEAGVELGLNACTVGVVSLNDDYKQFATINRFVCFDLVYVENDEPVMDHPLSIISEKVGK